MIETVKDEFNGRSEEIDEMFSHIKSFTDKEGYPGAEASTLVSILSSSLCLMIYNQVEATAFACVEAIYDELEGRKVSFNKLVPSFKRKILDDCRVYSSGEKLLERIQGSDIGEAIAKASLKLDRVFGGNIDAKKLREIMELYNLVITPLSYENSGADLLAIKDARKALAHGSSSFEKYGRNLALTDLNRLRNNVREYMQHVISLTEKYLDSRMYLAEPNVA